jgi:mono/diheme cytochrome c family protein
MRLGLLLISVPALLLSQQNADRVARGKYLVENVAVCQDCHTPRLDNRELDKSKWMKGAVMEFAPLNPIPNWHKTSPDLTPSGTLWKKWGPEAIVNFLHTGKTPKGAHAGPPMPTYTMTREDAAAVVEYLKTLP